MRYVLYFLQMEERNFLLKCFQHVSEGYSFALYRLAQRPEIWSSPMSDIQGEGTNGSGYAPAPEGHPMLDLEALNWFLSTPRNV